MGLAADSELLARAVNNPGRLVFGPTTVVGGFPFGGLPVGFTRFMELRIATEYQTIREPAIGQVAEVARRSVENPALGCMIEGIQADEDLIAAIFLKVARASALSVTSPAETQIIGSSSPRAVRALPPLLFVPFSPSGNAVYFVRPAALLDLLDAIQFDSERKATMPLVFLPLPALNRDPWQISRLENITL